MLRYGLVFLFAFSLIPFVYAQETATIDSYFSNLNYLFGETESINIFFPISLMLLVIIFTSYSLTHQTDRLSSVFSIGAVPICIILSLMFISPVSFDYTTSTLSVEIISDSNNNVTSSVLNSTQTIPIIPNDQQFRYIYSSFFLVFALFNGFLTILIMTGKVI